MTSPSERNAAGKLNLTRSQLARDLPERVPQLRTWVTRGIISELCGGIHAGERRMVEHIVKFGSQLKRDSFSDRDILEQRHVPVIGACPAEYDPAGVAHE